jgi:hypothetical protein
VTIRGHDITPVSEHLGYFNRDNIEGVPASKHRRNKNSIFTHFGVKTRFAFSQLASSYAGAGLNILRFQQYQRSDEAFTRTVTLDFAGNLRDSVGISFANKPTWPDFSAVSLFNRLYLTPHDNVTGLTGDFVYVWDGVTFRKAAGLAPVNGAPPFAVATGAAGRITKGRHLISVAYETDSGFITKPGPVLFYKAPGKRKANISNIPIGPAGTIYRHILMTKVIKTYDGNPTHYELFFVPGGTILDNVTTTLTIDALDSELLNSADYLLDLLEEIPAFLGFTTYQGSLVGFGEFGKEAVARVSIAGSPESFNGTDGFVIVAPGDGGGVNNSREYRGNLEFWKDNRTFATRANGDSPSTWTVTQIDGGYGTKTPRGVTAVLDSLGDSKDTLLICDDSGLLLFYGRYSDKPLTWQVDTEWMTDFGGDSSVSLDSIHKRLYVVGNSSVLMGDFANGLDPDNIRWSLWTFQNEAFGAKIPKQMVVSAYNTLLMFTSEEFLFYYDSTSRNDQIGTPDAGEPPIYANSPIDHDLIFPYLDDINNYLLHFAGVRYRLTGEGALNISYFITDNIESTPEVRTMITAPGRDYNNLFNAVDERMSLRFRVNALNEYIEGLDTLGLMIKPSWKSRILS